MDLWQYCTPEHCREYIVSLKLLGNTPMTEEKQLRCLYALSNHPERHYRTIRIPKRDGTMRTVREPDDLLKLIQKQILRHILEAAPVSEYAFAYKKGSGIRDNAAVHVGQPMILKLDIHDFFGSITFPMVMRSAFPARIFPPAVGTLLTNLCCYRDCLVQGAPTSAAISNLVMEPFDRSMGQWCEERGIRYSRYCDDMTFSGDFDAAAVTAKARSFLEAMGFSLNKKKTRILASGVSQTVTGLVVNEKLQVPREYRRRLRQEIYYCERFGVKAHLIRLGHTETDQEAQKRYLEILSGKAGYLLSVAPDSKEAREMRKKIRDLIKKQLEI